MIGDIGGRSGAGPELSMMSLIVFCGKIELFLENFRPGPEILPYPEKGRTEKSEARADG